MLAQRPVIDKAVLRILGDLDDVANCVAEHDLGLRPVGREDEVLELAVDPGHP